MYEKGKFETEGFVRRVFLRPGVLSGCAKIPEVLSARDFVHVPLERFPFEKNGREGVATNFLHNAQYNP